jgi:hypothetical protein
MSVNGKAHEKPPARIKGTYKTYQKLDRASLDKQPELIDLRRSDLKNSHQLIQSKSQLLPTELREICLDFLNSNQHGVAQSSSLEQPQVFRVPSVPGKLSTDFTNPIPSEYGRSVHLSVPTSTSCPNWPTE